MTAVSEYELAVLNIVISYMLVFQYVWKYIILVIGTSRLSLYENYEEYRVSLLPPPTHAL